MSADTAAEACACSNRRGTDAYETWCSRMHAPVRAPVHALAHTTLGCSASSDGCSLGRCRSGKLCALERNSPRIRDAMDADMPAVRDLYNALIPTTTVAWTESPQTLRERRAWFHNQQRNGYPVLVAEAANEVVGFAAYAGFRGSGKWPGYRHTVEHTIHVRDDMQTRGIGRALLEALVDKARAADIHVMVAAIDGANTSSIAFHEHLGFVVVARMPEVGRKFDRWLDLVLMQRII